MNFIDFSLLKEGYHIDPGVLGTFARIIIESVGLIGVGIICFALVLKAIVLPFDIYQRVKMRKQTLIMREMQPELEKLQKQYANDKTAYNQKMMELYKKNGYSMLGACLPMIISMVILIVAFQGFRTYSTAANLNMYVRLSEAYNAALNEYVVKGDDGIEISDWKEVAEETINEIRYHVYIEDSERADSSTGAIDGISYRKLIPVGKEDDENTIQYILVQSEDPENIIPISYWYPIDKQTGKMNGDKEYKINKDKLFAVADGAIAQDASDDAYVDYLVKIGGTAVKEAYKSDNSSFLWIKNVWHPDVSYQHPIQSYKSFSDTFKSSTLKFDDGTVVKKNLPSVISETQYNRLISELGSEKKAANGYFILIILSIGLMVLSQFISMRSQKESNKYQTVDGSGAKTQKIMLVMMPLIYAVFAFMYSAAFSIYMVVSSFISICITLLSNLILGRVFHKKEVEKIKEKNTRMPAWMKQQEAKKGKKGKK